MNRRAFCTALAALVAAPMTALQATFIRPVRVYCWEEIWLGENWTYPDWLYEAAQTWAQETA